MNILAILSALDPISVSYNSRTPHAEEISLLTQDARKVIAKAIFVAVPGSQADGHIFIADAIKNGASALVVEKIELVPKDFKGTVVHVKSSRQALDRMASRIAGEPTDSLLTLGVTGTNGKTSVTYMLEWILNSAKIHTGVLGTIDHHVGPRKWPSEMTTPEPIQLQSRIKEMKAAGAKAIAMEVSSHALDQYRADSVHFDGVAFTNLTRDHLDYHGSMENYFAAKQRFFTEVIEQSNKKKIIAAINGDDEWGQKLQVSSKAKRITFGQGSECDVKFQITGISFAGTDFKYNNGQVQLNGHIPSIGVHNLYNTATAIILSELGNVGAKIALESMHNFPGVPGRLQKVPTKLNRHVYVDYAHSPDALENVLKALILVRSQSKTSNKIITVFGCGGDRDKGKRPMMAKIAAQMSDCVIVTSDNPRLEDPARIIDEIEVGFGTVKDSRLHREEDRKNAIQKAIELSKEGDVVLIAGKGHEDYQLIGERKLPFSDLEVAKEFLK